MVIEVRQLLQQGLPGLVLFGQDGLRHLEQVRILAGLVLVGVLTDEVHIARDLVAIPDGDLHQHQGTLGHRLEGIQDVLQACGSAWGLHLVQEEDVGDLVVVEELEGRRDHQGAVGIGIADHHGDVGHHEDVGRLLAELHGARAVDEGPGLAVVRAGGQAGFHAHLPGLGLGGGVTDGVPLLDGALARQGARCEEQALHQGGLSREIGANNGRYPGSWLRISAHSASGLVVSIRDRPKCSDPVTPWQH